MNKNILTGLISSYSYSNIMKVFVASMIICQVLLYVIKLSMATQMQCLLKIICLIALVYFRFSFKLCHALKYQGR